MCRDYENQRCCTGERPNAKMNEFSCPSKVVKQALFRTPFLRIAAGLRRHPMGEERLGFTCSCQSHVPQQHSIALGWRVGLAASQFLTRRGSQQPGNRRTSGIQRQRCFEHHSLAAMSVLPLVPLVHPELRQAYVVCCSNKKASSSNSQVFLDPFLEMLEQTCGIACAMQGSFIVPCIGGSREPFARTLCALFTADKQLQQQRAPARSPSSYFKVPSHSAPGGHQVLAVLHRVHLHVTYVVEELLEEVIRNVMAELVHILIAVDCR